VTALAASALLVGGLTACSGGKDKAGGGLSIVAPGGADASTSTSTSTSTSSTSTTAPPPPGLGPGATGPVVATLEAKLVSLHYEVGSVDDTYDQDTAYAVTAFQKVTGAERTGRATDDVIAAVNAATSSPAPLMPGGGPDRVEVDLARQVLFLYEGDTLAKILTVSTGSGERYCSQGYCRKAITDSGSFKVYRQARGWETGPLGRLYNPNYFDGGIAIHGATSVPASPASHGCVRIPMHAAEWFPSHLSLGTPVYVAGPDGIPPPLPEPPPDTPPPPDVTSPTTTTLPATTTTVAKAPRLFGPKTP